MFFKCNQVISNNSETIIHTQIYPTKRLPFYVYGCGHFFANEGYYTEREGMNNLLLFITLSGSGIIKFRGINMQVSANQIALISCSEYQYYGTAPNNTWEFKWIHFYGSACNEYLYLINRDSFQTVTLNDLSEVLGVYDEIRTLTLENSFTSDIKITSMLTQILTTIIISKHNELINDTHIHHSMIIEKAVEYINENYEKDINIDKICGTLHISKYYFSRLFKMYSGLSPYQYIIKLRVNQAKMFLTETDLPISQICFKVGFNDINNFIRTFKQVEGITPLKFRNNLFILYGKFY